LESVTFTFSNSQGDNPYTVASLLEKVVSQDKLRHNDSTTQMATALIAGHGINNRSNKFKKNNNKQGKNKKRYQIKDCKSFVRVHFHKLCDDCFIPHSEKSAAEDASAALADVPASMCAQNRERKRKNLKRKWLR
jgi:hypothetical protein